MKRLIFVLLLTISVLFPGCRPQSVNPRRVAAVLDDVETYINERPDSALAVLRALDSTAVRGRALRARVSLLHSMALDKNYIDLKTDSILAPAVSWYSRHGSPDEKLKTRYYLGRLQYNAGNYQEAIVTYTEALEMTAKAKDLKYVGFVNQAIADTYASTYQYGDATQFLSKAYEVFLQIPDSILAKKTLYNKALNYSNQKEWKEAERLFSSLLSFPSGIESLVPKIKANYALSLVQKDSHKSKEVVELFQEVLQEVGSLPSPNHWAAFAYCLSRENEASKSKALFDQLKAMFPEDKRIAYWLSCAEHEKGDSGKAYDLFHSAMNYQDSILRVQLEHSTMLAQKEYFENKALLEQEQANRRMYLLWIVIISFVSITAVAFFIIRDLMRKARNERLRLLQTIETVRQKAAHMKSVSQDQENANQRWQRQYTLLFQDYFNTLGQICADYEEGSLAYNRSSDRAIIRRLDRIVADFSGNTGNHEAFEQMLNHHLDNIMSDFRHDYPNMQAQRYQLISYIFAGIDMPTASVLLGVDVDALYARKYRIKSYISGSSVPGKERYLQFFN